MGGGGGGGRCCIKDPITTVTSVKNKIQTCLILQLNGKLCVLQPVLETA